MTAIALPQDAPNLHLGDRVRITQLIVGRNGHWPTTVEGIVEACRPEPTGSWFAHGKNDRLWLLRVRIRKDDGEVTTLALDPRSRVERI